MTMVTDTATMDTIYSRGAGAEDVDVNYYPSSRGGPSTSASFVAVRGAHLAFPDGFCLCWDNNGEKKHFRRRGGGGRKRTRMRKWRKRRRRGGIDRPWRKFWMTAGSARLREAGSAAAPIAAAVMSTVNPTNRGGRWNTVGTAGEVWIEVAENGGG